MNQKWHAKIPYTSRFSYVRKPQKNFFKVRDDAKSAERPRRWNLSFA